MLNSLRNAAGTWVAKLLLILLVLSFAVWGISGQILGGLGSHVLQVGDTRVSILEYRLAYDRQLSQLSRQFGMQITREQARAFGVDQQVLTQLLAGAVLDEQAREMRLGLSRDRLAALTAEDPDFAGPDGRFDRNQFEYVLRQVGMRPEDYLRNREQVAVRQQIVEAVSDGLTVPDAFLRGFALHGGEDRTVEFLVLPKSLVEPVEPASDEALATYFEENKQTYAAPEYRSISYVKLEPEDIADPASISDEQVAEYYQGNVARFTTAERRTIEQLVFANREAADSALARIRAGTPFEEVVTAEGKTLQDVLLGTFDKARVADPAIADAAFALAQGEVSEVIDGAFGPILLRVTEITPEVVKPVEEVREEIRRDLSLDEANRVLMDVHDAYEDARASGDSMADAAARQRLTMVTVEAVDRSARDPQGTILTDLPESSQLLSDAFETEVGIENPPISVGAHGYLFYEVNSVTPARDRTLDEVRDRVAADWLARETTNLLATRAEELRNQAQDGKALNEMATELALELRTRFGLKRNADDAELGDAGVAAAFGVQRNGVGIAPSGSGDAQILFKVTDVIQPLDASAETVDEQQRTAFGRGMSDDLLDQLVAKLQTQYVVTVDQRAIDQALSF